MTDHTWKIWEEYSASSIRYDIICTRCALRVPSKDGVTPVMDAPLSKSPYECDFLVVKGVLEE